MTHFDRKINWQVEVVLTPEDPTNEQLHFLPSFGLRVTLAGSDLSPVLSLTLIYQTVPNSVHPS